MSKADQIDLLNRSVEYFKSHDKFEKESFEAEVFDNPEIIQSFRNFDEQYRESKNVDISDNFQISSQAVKKQSRVFKSVLKLDKNFDIHIHGNKDLIEKGVERDGRKYYKIYYDEEK
ncbi:37-kD nucleoid-associated bacterial protein [compost metagenome]